MVLAILVIGGGMVLFLLTPWHFSGQAQKMSEPKFLGPSPAWSELRAYKPGSNPTPNGQNPGPTSLARTKPKSWFFASPSPARPDMQAWPGLA
jgi:hypothetical protein